MGGCMSTASNASNSRDAPADGGAAGYAGDIFAMLVKPDKAQQSAKRSAASVRATGAPVTEEFATRSADTIPASVRMFSGCMDTQTSADVSDVTSFGLPPVSDAEKAGGACTNGLLSTLNDRGEISFGDLLVSMQKTLKGRGYTQVPQLSSSNNVELKTEQFSVWNGEKTGRHRSCLVGVNYVGQQGELAGCVNDVKMMKDYIEKQGFQSDDDHMRVIADDAGFTNRSPTGGEIAKGMKWLVDGAEAGDSLFFHYSGHGSQARDETGDEEDGMDETIVPVDYQRNGMITDDTIFQLLVAPLPKGVQLVCVFDCCHSGTILDLPFIFSATEEAVQMIESGDAVAMQQNPGFSFGAAKALVMQAAKGVLNQVLKSQMAGGTRSAGGLAKGGSLQGTLFSLASGVLGSQ